MAIYRDRHWTDIPHPSLGGRRRRRIGNHLNYKGPGGLFLPAQANVQAAQGPPPNWVGQFDFRDTSIEAPLQFFAHDATDPDNRAMIGVRVDDTPDVWANIKAADVVPGVATQSPDSITREWPGLWANSTLRWIHGGHKAVKEIVLSAPGHPGYFDFLLRISPGASFELADNVYRIRDAQGEEKILSRAPYGWDAAETNIRCTLSYLGTEGPGGRYHRVRLTPNADDLAGAVYPVTLDPTTTISGTSGIEDNWLYKNFSSTSLDNNYGGQTSIVLREGSERGKGIFRVDETQIPSGTLSQVVFNAYCYNRILGTEDVQAHRVASGNYSWAEGTSSGSAQTGSSCWNYLAYDASSPTSWAGTAGCDTSGTDYVADASPPTVASVATGNPLVFDLSTQGIDWFTDFRDTPANNGGIILSINGSNTFEGIRSTEHTTPSETPSFDITYTVSTGQPTWIRWTPPHVAGRNALFRGSF